MDGFQGAAVACGSTITFDDIGIMIEFLRMMAHQIVPEQFLSFVHAVATAHDADQRAAQLVKMCVGQGA